MLTDPISDMLTRIRNANLNRQRHVVIPSSVLKVGIARILAEEGFIGEYVVTDEHPQPNLILALKYTGKGNSVITGLRRISKPGRRLYAGYREIPWVRSGLGINIVSTPKGLLTGRQARKAKVGGEIICEIW